MDEITEGSMSYNFDFFINRINYETYHKDIHKKVIV